MTIWKNITVKVKRHEQVAFLTAETWGTVSDLEILRFNFLSSTLDLHCLFSSRIKKILCSFIGETTQNTGSTQRNLFVLRQITSVQGVWCQLPPSESKVAPQSSAASNSANTALVLMRSKLEGEWYWSDILLDKYKGNFLWELTPTVTICMWPTTYQGTAESPSRKRKVSNTTQLRERKVCSSRTFQLSWSLKEIKMLLHACHSAGCKYVFYKYCKRKNSSNIEQAGKTYTNNLHVHMYYCLKTNPLKDQTP